MRDIICAVKDTITQIGLGNRTKPSDRTAFGKGSGLALSHMRGMNQTPFFIHLTLPQNPFDRTRAPHCEHLLDFFCLFRNMHVHRHPSMQIQRLAQARLGCGAQGMRCNADTRIRWQRSHCTMASRDNVRKCINRIAKAQLPPGKRLGLQAAISI